MKFENKTALVTGSGRGIGREIALRLAQQGADIVVNYFRNRQPAEETAAEIEALGRKALIVKANMGEPKDIKALFAAIEEAFGGLDILVNNAASGFNRPIMEQRAKGWDWTMNINARSAMLNGQQALPLMQKRGGGAIVNITSPGSTRVLPDYVVVGASKAALESVTRYLAVEFAPHNIVVNAVSPGLVETDALNHFLVTKDSRHVLDEAVKHVPAGRFVYPSDVADIVEFLCTPQAQMIRGQVIQVDGGQQLAVAGSPRFTDLL